MLLDQPVEEHVVSAYRVKTAGEPWELRDAFALRRAVFCHEQGVLTGDDRDEVDARGTLLVAVSCVGGMPDQVVGTVRIAAAPEGTWWGSRLAVHPSFRRVRHIGAALIELAVRTAHTHGCTAFFAHVQSQNAPMFERLHWRTLDRLVLHGRPHHLMRADLEWYPPLAAGRAELMLAGA